MRFCTQCGIELRRPSPFCTHCGTPLAAFRPPVAPQPPPPPPAAPPPPVLAAQLALPPAVPPPPPLAAQLALPPAVPPPPPLAAQLALPPAAPPPPPLAAQLALPPVEQPAPPEDPPLIVEALKSTNTCLLWVSLDYWTLYADRDRVALYRCYRGKWGLIGFVLGFCFALAPSLIIGALGVLLDRQNGTSACRILADSLRRPGVRLRPSKTITALRGNLGAIRGSDLCLGNIWLKYMFKAGGKDFYFEESKYEQVRAIMVSRGTRTT